MARDLKKMPDDILIALARGGNERAFETLVKRYEQTVYGFSIKVCRDKGKAEETLQDTFVNVYTHLGKYRSASKFSTWLYSIVANNCLMKHRVRKIDEVMEALDEPPSAFEESKTRQFALLNDSPEDRLLTKELRAHLDAAIQKLPMDYRIVFVMRNLEMLSAEETAKILKLSIPAVKSRLRRARVFLRNELAEFEVD